ncbi:MAG: type II secretion system protein GspL [Halioglobus sp.]|nr:type II secretion system protein GspL [Halioglobus sp.]
MRSTAVVRLIDGRLAWYPPGASDGPQWLDDEIQADTLRAALSQRRMRVVFAAPGADVRLLRLSVTPEEKKHIDRSLPFMLEEQVAADVEDLHFAHQAQDKTQYTVGVVASDAMAGWEAHLSDFQGITTWVPEPLLLPWQRGEWCLVLEGERAILRCGSADGFSVERDLLPILLGGLTGEDATPEAIVIYGADQAADTDLVPEQLRDRVQWRDGDFYSALLLADEEVPLNLLQGDFAPRLPLGRWWRHWRAAAALFVAAFLLQLVALYADYRNLNAQNLALRGAVEESYRKANPRGVINEAERQLTRQLNALRGTGQTSGFTSLMHRVGTAVASMPGTSIASINYSDKGDSMRMNVVAKDFEGVEQLRQKLAGAGLKAVMESSNAQDKGVRARLRVEVAS